MRVFVKAGHHSFIGCVGVCAYMIFQDLGRCQFCCNLGVPAIQSCQKGWDTEFFQNYCFKDTYPLPNPMLAK